MSHEQYTSDLSESELHLFFLEYNESVKSKSTARLLMLLLPLTGAGRFYVGDVQKGILQLFLIPIGYFLGLFLGLGLLGNFGFIAIIAAPITSIAGMFGAVVAAGIWWVIDLFRIGEIVDKVNNDNAKKISKSLKNRRHQTAGEVNPTVPRTPKGEEPQAERETAPALAPIPTPTPTPIKEHETTNTSQLRDKWRLNANTSREAREATRTSYRKTQSDIYTDKSQFWKVAVAVVAVIVSAIVLVNISSKGGSTTTPMGIPDSPPQLADVQIAMKRAAFSYLESIVNKNYSRTAQYLSPKRIDQLGGLKSAIDSLKQENIKSSILSFQHLGQSLIQIDENQYVGVVVMSTKGIRQNILTGKTERVRVEGGLLAYSKNGGENWTFSGTSTEDKKQVKKEMGRAVDKLTIPRQKVEVESSGKQGSKGKKI